MRYTAAYLLAILGGNPSPDVAAIAKILGSVGIECDENRAQKVVDACKGRDVNEAIAYGMTKMDDAVANTSVGTNIEEKSGLGLKIEPPVAPPILVRDDSIDSPPGSPGSGSFIGLFDD